jgi:hypothetical protein
MIAFMAAALALSGASETAQDRAAPPTSAAAAQTPAAQAALQFLALVDASNWAESWAATASSFRSLNTVEAWQSASLQVRVPLGRVVSRSLAGEESVPAPPAGYQVVRFRTRFANDQAEKVETLSLAREGEGWRVAGYYIQ